MRGPKSAIAKMMNAQVANTTEATDAEVKDFYDKNPDRFKRAESVRASHILLMVDPKADEATKQQTRTKIDGILKRAKGGEDFAALAKENSQDGSAAQGGDLGYFPKEKMVPAFADVAFALKTGEISDVVTTQFGVHIIKVTDRKPAGTVPLEEVSAAGQGVPDASRRSSNRRRPSSSRSGRRPRSRSSSERGSPLRGG